jgi:hypothetical protein
MQELEQQLLDEQTRSSTLQEQVSMLQRGKLLGVKAARNVDNSSASSDDSGCDGEDTENEEEADADKSDKSEEAENVEN